MAAEALNGFATFTAFQAAIEGAVHAGVHSAVGGDMETGSSPSDPLFWLHHANIDRLWAKWQKQHPGERVHITPKTVHRMTAIEDSDIFEVSTPELDDVVRLEDRYGRQDKN